MTLANQLMFRFCLWVARGVVARILRERNGGSGRLSYGPRPDHGARTYAFFSSFFTESTSLRPSLVVSFGL